MDEIEDNLLSQLYGELQAAIRQSWSAAVAKHPGEHIYAYTLYTEPLLGYLIPAYHSEETLARIALDEEQRDDLRWSPQDWVCFPENEELFSKVGDVLNALNAMVDARNDLHRQKRWQVFLEALSSLDDEGVFGYGDFRDALTINIMWGDQDVVAHIESARQLNPLKSYLLYAESQLNVLNSLLREWGESASTTSSKMEAIVRVQSAIAMIK
jgi:hypothetical protein